MYNREGARRVKIPDKPVGGEIENMGVGWIRVKPRSFVLGHPGSFGAVIPVESRKETVIVHRTFLPVAGA